MWEQHEKPAESQVLWLYLVASEEIRKSETERRLGVEKGLTNTQTKVAERVCTAICTHTHTQSHHPMHWGKAKANFHGSVAVLSTHKSL